MEKSKKTSEKAGKKLRELNEKQLKEVAGAGCKGCGALASVESFAIVIGS
jgi:hypothetical protein